MTVFEIFAAKGSEVYFGEPVSQLEHALQAAHLAEQDGAPPWLIVAALLHDIGHLLHGLPEYIADEGIDARHEDIGHAWLAQYFGPEITAPVRMHVDAKRYLCATDPEYLQFLSPASVQSLQLQGGAFTDAEARQFEQRPFAREAVRLRRWDDQAKVPGLHVPELEYYRDLIDAAQLRAYDQEVLHSIPNGYTVKGGTRAGFPTLACVLLRRRRREMRTVNVITLARVIITVNVMVNISLPPFT